jgi:hypothetical protein
MRCEVGRERATTTRYGWEDEGIRPVELLVLYGSLMSGSSKIYQIKKIEQGLQKREN